MVPGHQDGYSWVLKLTRNVFSFSNDAGSLGTGTQIGFYKTNQEGLWLLEGWKSNVSQQEVREEFTEDVGEQIKRAFGRLGNKRSTSLIFLQALEFFTDDGDLAYMSSQVSRNW